MFLKPRKRWRLLLKMVKIRKMGICTADTKYHYNQYSLIYVYGCAIMQIFCED